LAIRGRQIANVHLVKQECQIISKYLAIQEDCQNASNNLAITERQIASDQDDTCPLHLAMLADVIKPRVGGYMLNTVLHLLKTYLNQS
jgi:hypothetical protein